MRLVICVSLRTAASAEAPLGPILFQERLPGGWAGAVSERAGACQWALTQKRTLYRAAAYPRVVICVSLRTAASAEAPSAPISLLLILRHG